MVEPGVGFVVGVVVSGFSHAESGGQADEEPLAVVEGGFAETLGACEVVAIELLARLLEHFEHDAGDIGVREELAFLKGFELFSDFSKICKNLAGSVVYELLISVVFLVDLFEERNKAVSDYGTDEAVLESDGHVHIHDLDQRRVEEDLKQAIKLEGSRNNYRNAVEPHGRIELEDGVVLGMLRVNFRPAVVVDDRRVLRAEPLRGKLEHLGDRADSLPGSRKCRLQRKLRTHSGFICW
ncbi:hypothetical protein L596_007611 [Steinernema carpocapsae]|uniref:Uncharacterized protein n=1 Tax=Steinernema carpocapsae TaxID=34508 RepID=A0A4V6A628_STECR|nr:hypothetical protein L596_007611 [Steinernema carpocapsae]